MSEEIQDWWALAERNRELSEEVIQLRKENEQTTAAWNGHKAVVGSIMQTLEQLSAEYQAYRETALVEADLLRKEIERLNHEYICKKCGLRQNSNQEPPTF